MTTAVRAVALAVLLAGSGLAVATRGRLWPELLPVLIAGGALGLLIPQYALGGAA